MYKQNFADKLKMIVNNFTVKEKNVPPKSAVQLK